MLEETHWIKFYYLSIYRKKIPQICTNANNWQD